jgi:CRP-like cAMP-binding protein
MRKLVQSFVLRRYQRNHFVYNQGEISQHVYIVQGGDFEVVRKKRNQKQIAQDAKKLIGPGYNEKLQQSLIKTDKPGNRQMNLDKPASFFDIRILKASKGYLLGHEDVINDRRYTTSVRCQSLEGTLFVMKADEFFSKMN